MFRHIGRSKIVLRNGSTARQKTADAVLWEDLGGNSPRYFFVRPIASKKYHVRIIVGTVITTDRNEVGKGEVVRAARLMGITVLDNHWSVIDSLL